MFISNRFASADEDDSVLLKNIDRAVESVGDVNFGIYECPYPYKRVMTPEVLKKLAESGRFTFLKDTCCDPGMINENSEPLTAWDSRYSTPTPRACSKR